MKIDLFDKMFIFITTIMNLVCSCLGIFFICGITAVGFYSLAVIICFFTCSTLTCIKYKHEILNKIMNGGKMK